MNFNLHNNSRGGYYVKEMSITLSREIHISDTYGCALGIALTRKVRFRKGETQPGEEGACETAEGTI